MLPKPNSSFICKFRPTVFGMDANKEVVNWKMQVVALEARSKEEGGNLKVHFNLMIYNLVLHPKLIYKF